MDTQQPGFASNLRFYSRYLLFFLLIFMMPYASAEDSDQNCQISAIAKAFRKSETPVGPEQLSDIQSKLNISGYGQLDTDGKLGPATLEALNKLCVDYTLESADDLVTRLMSLLELTFTVAQKHPDWRKLIESKDFQDWLQQQSKAEQERMSKTLQAGPAEQVIAILDGYPDNKPAVGEETTAPAKKKCQYLPAAVSGPTVFYRWQTDEEESEGDEDKAGQECADVPLSDDVMTGLSAIEGIAYPNEILFKQALATRLTDLKNDDQKQILQRARVGPVDELKKIQLSGGDCGCSRDFSRKVVGFYPSWLANDDIQQVDFSLFDRIGFYALTLNEAGRIEDHLQWSDTGDAAAFINKAHKFRVEVDLTIYASAWQQWENKEINTAARSVAKAVKQKFHYSHTSGLRAIFPFLDDTSSVTVDGVTLFFDNYTKPSSSKKVVSIVTRVAQALDDADSDARLNILLGLNMDTIEKEQLNKDQKKQPLFKDLACILLDENESEVKQEACELQGIKDSKVDIEYVFAYLQEPTTDSKKILRRKIEDDFSGLNRKTVLRKVMPIISPTGHDRDPRGAFSQFTDDLIYFQDNFAGVGLWPLPLASDAEMKTIKAKLIELYKETNGSDHLGGMIDTYAPWLCEFACPNRWLFRVSFDLLAGLLVIYALLAIWICRLRSLYKQYFLYFLAVGLATVLISLISLVCDPFWNERADSVVITVFLIALVAIIWRSVSKATQPPLP